MVTYSSFKLGDEKALALNLGSLVRRKVYAAAVLLNHALYYTYCVCTAKDEGVTWVVLSAAEGQSIYQLYLSADPRALSFF